MDITEVIDPRKEENGVPLRIVGYARESTREQAENGFNLDEQVRRIEEYVDLYYERKDIKFEITREEGASARSLQRPIMKEILRRIENGEINILIVHNLDRLTRVLVDMHDLLGIFEKHNVQLISLKEMIDTATPQGRFFISMIVLIAQWEEDTIADRTTRGMQESARQGNYAKPKVPFGYYRNPNNTKRLLINDEEAKVVNYIFTSIAKKVHTPFTIAKELREKKIMDRKWTDATVMAMVRNRAYYGTFEWHGEMYDNHTPAIVSKELWERANENAACREFHKNSYLFKDKVRCDSCGCICDQTCTTKKDGTTYLYYFCPECNFYINEKKIFSQVGDSLNEMVHNHHIYDELRNVRTHKANAEKQLKELMYGRINHSLDKNYFQEQMSIQSEKKRIAEQTIRDRKEIIDQMTFRNISDEERKELVRKYLNYIDVSFLTKETTPSFSDEYKRICNYVF